MDENEVKNVCGAAMLDYDGSVLESLSIIEGMMEAVVNSDLCVAEDQGGQSSRSRTAEGELREDMPHSDFTRDEMLSNSNCRKGHYTAVPQVIKV